MEESIFTKIIRGEVPSYKIAENEKTIAILPLHPMGKAHVLVIPKKQVDQFFELEELDYSALMSMVKKVARKIENVIHPKRVGLKVVGLDVPHAHIHVIGFDSLDEYQEIEQIDAPVNKEQLERLHKLLAF